jgi:hypothetical protein
MTGEPAEIEILGKPQSAAKSAHHKMTLQLVETLGTASDEGVLWTPEQSCHRDSSEQR